MIYKHEINLNLLQRKPNFGDHLYLNECQLLYVLFFNCLLVLFSLILPPYPAQECGDYVHTLPKNAEIMSIPCPRMRRLCPYPSQECGDYVHTLPKNAEIILSVSRARTLAIFWY